MEKGQISMATEEEKGRNLTGRKVGGWCSGKELLDGHDLERARRPERRALREK